jgi:hypothetical protein
LDETIFLGAGTQVIALRYDPEGAAVPPAAPQNPYPADGAGNVDLETRLEWGPPADPCDPLVYDVYFGLLEDPPFAGQVNGFPSLDSTLLEATRTYHWRVEVTDRQGDRIAGPNWSFTTSRTDSKDPNPPAPAIFVQDRGRNPLVSCGLVVIFLFAASAAFVYWHLRGKSDLSRDAIPEWYSLETHDLASAVDDSDEAETLHG